MFKPIAIAASVLVAGGLSVGAVVGLPLLVVLATVFIMALMLFGARNLLFRPRKEDETDKNSEGGSENG